MNWAYVLILEALGLSVVLNLIFYAIYKAAQKKKNKED